MSNTEELIAKVAKQAEAEYIRSMNKRFAVENEECVAGEGVTYTEYSVRDRLTGNVVSLCWDREVARLTADALEAKAAGTKGTIRA